MNKQEDYNDLPKLSLYRYENFFNVYEEIDNTKFYNLLRSINIFSAKDSSAEDEYSVVPNDTWVYISYKYYGTMDLWWLVCEYNQIKDATSIPQPGVILKLLKKELVWTIISELKKQINR